MHQRIDRPNLVSVKLHGTIKCRKVFFSIKKPHVSAPVVKVAVILSKSLLVRKEINLDTELVDRSPQRNIEMSKSYVKRRVSEIRYLRRQNLKRLRHRERAAAKSSQS